MVDVREPVAVVNQPGMVPGLVVPMIGYTAISRADVMAFTMEGVRSQVDVSVTDNNQRLRQNN